MTRSDFKNKILRKLGSPYIKVELTDDMIEDHIETALNKFIEYAISQATDEVYMTVLLSAGERFYDLPDGTYSVVDYEDNSIGVDNGHNTLFTIQNYMYMNGYLDYSMDNGCNLLSLHMEKDFIKTLKKYSSSGYQWRYHELTNQLEIIPQVRYDCGYINWEEYDEDGNIISKSAKSPGWVLLRTYMYKGATLPNWNIEKTYEWLFEKCDWLFEYVEALCKMNLALIRRKYKGNGPIGTVGFDMDGDDLYSEGKEAKQELEERLDDTESYEGWTISIG